jgi:hypothetical protein
VPIERLTTRVFEEAIVAIRFKASLTLDMNKAISQSRVSGSLETNDVKTLEA